MHTGPMTSRAARRFAASLWLLVPWVGACKAESPRAASEHAHPAFVTSTANVEKLANASPKSLLSWADGMQAEYSIVLKSKAHLSTSRELLDLSLSGRLVIRQLEEQGSSLYVRLAQVELKVNSRADAPELTDLRRELESGFVLAADDGVQRVSMSRTHSQFAANIAQTIAAGLQLPVPPNQASATWEHDEADASGPYTAQYQREPERERYRKTKLRYVTPPGGRVQELGVSLDLTPNILESRGILELERGQLTMLSYEEKLQSHLLEQASVTAETELLLKVVARHAAPALSAELDALRPQLAPLAQDRVERTTSDSRFDESKIGRYDFQSALATVERITNDGATFKSDASRDPDPAREQKIASHTEAFIALVAILRTQPKALVAAAARIRRDPQHAQVLLNALTAAETPESQGVLLELARATTTTASLRESIALSLVRVSKPSNELIEGLIAWLPERQLGIYAIYGLGAMARAIRPEQPAVAARIGRVLSERLLQEESSAMRIHLLRGVANSGDSAAFAAVAPLLTSDDDSTRGAAVEALRLMDHPEVDEVIAGRLLEERSHVALRAAINAAKTRSPSGALAAALSQVALQSDDSQARYRAVLLMSTWLAAEPALRQPLTTIAATDQAEDVRNAAKDALSHG